MYCSKCGSQVADNATFCVNCGERIAGPSLPLPAATLPSVPPAAHYSAPPPVATYAPPPPAGTWPSSAALPPGAAATPVYIPMPSPFAGFWLRFVALIIDAIIIMFGAGIFIALIVAIIGVGAIQSAFENSDNSPDFFPFTIVFGFIVAFLGIAVGEWLYFAWMESSSHQGTLGKISLGLIVTDLQGRRITFARATGRYFSKIITNMTFYIGYIMAGFTEKKQALHDMIASCLVLRKS